MSMVNCQRCGTPMNVHGKVAPDDTFICNDCHKAISKPVHPALGANPIEMVKLQEALERNRNPEIFKWSEQPGLWGSSGFVVHAVHKAHNGQYTPSMELVDGVNEEDARRKMLNRTRALLEDPNCVRVVTAAVISEMRKVQVNGHDHGIPARGE